MNMTVPSPDEAVDYVPKLGIVLSRTVIVLWIPVLIMSFLSLPLAVLSSPPVNHAAYVFLHLVSAVEVTVWSKIKKSCPYLYPWRVSPSCAAASGLPFVFLPSYYLPELTSHPSLSQHTSFSMDKYSSHHPYSSLLAPPLRIFANSFPLPHHSHHRFTSLLGT